MTKDSVTLLELNSLVRSVVEQSLDGEYWLEAELSEARLAQNGHFYVEFVQKDASGRSFLARARATVWARTYNMIAPLFERATGERLRAGMKVRVLVTVAFHELYGYSLNVVNIDPSFTLGDLAQRRREILAQLEADGILEDNRQLPLPALLKRIAVVSSAGAAGYGDFCNQLANNDYGLCFHVQLFPAVMQGANVEESVLAALAAIADEAERWDCVVVIRGGGATSDLADFDSYPLAAAVAQMPLPVLVGIGHERDETVLDFVAHTRVKTPTAAAAFIIDHGAQQLALLDELQGRITQGVAMRVENLRLQLARLGLSFVQSAKFKVQSSKLKLEGLEQRFVQGSKFKVQSSKLKLESLEQRFGQSSKLKVHSSKLKLENLQARLAALDPVLQLQRGYTLTFTADGRLVHSAADVQRGDRLTTRFADGSVESVADNVLQRNDDLDRTMVGA